MLVIHLLCNLNIDILPRVPKGWLRPYKLLSGGATCELVGDFISMYPSMSRDPVEPHSVPVRDTIQHLLALLYQWRCCFGSLKSFQSRLTVRANTNIFLWPTLSFIVLNRLILHIPQPERL
jgi:hypothetical protein